MHRAVTAWLMTAALVAGLIAGCGNQSGAVAFQSSDVTGAEFGRKLALHGVDGQPRSLTDFSGKVLVVFFGFTHCPDVCPTTMVKLAQVMKSLGADANRVQVLLVTLDPERDSADLLAQYTAGFDPRFSGLSGSPAEIAEAAREFRVIYQKQPGATPDSYSVDHTTGTYVFDPRGRLRLFVSGQQEAKSIEHDIRLLLTGT